MFLHCSDPPRPSQFYTKSYSTKDKARFAISELANAFVLLFAYISFCIAIYRHPDNPLSVSSSSSTSAQPRWFQVLSSTKSRIHPEFLQLLADSPISNFIVIWYSNVPSFQDITCIWYSEHFLLLVFNTAIFMPSNCSLYLIQWPSWGYPGLLVVFCLSSALLLCLISFPFCILRNPSMGMYGSPFNPTYCSTRVTHGYFWVYPYPYPSIPVPIGMGMGTHGFLLGYMYGYTTQGYGYRYFVWKKLQL